MQPPINLDSREEIVRSLLDSDKKMDVANANAVADEVLRRRANPQKRKAQHRIKKDRSRANNAAGQRRLARIKAVGMIGQRYTITDAEIAELEQLKEG